MIPQFRFSIHLEGANRAGLFLAESSYRTGPSRYEELKRKVGIDPLVAVSKFPKKQAQTHCGFCLNNGELLIRKWLLEIKKCVERVA